MKPPEPEEPDQPDYTQTSVGMTDEDLRQILLASMRLCIMLCVVCMGLFWWRAGWQSAVLVLVGAAISLTSLREWMRIAAAMNRQMDGGGAATPGGMVAFGFVVRLMLTVAALYASLKYLHGTAFALAAGLGLGVVSLTVEALRVLRRGSV